MRVSIVYLDILFDHSKYRSRIEGLRGPISAVHGTMMFSRYYSVPEE